MVGSVYSGWLYSVHSRTSVEAEGNYVAVNITTAVVILSA